MSRPALWTLMRGAAAPVKRRKFVRSISRGRAKLLREYSNRQKRWKNLGANRRCRRCGCGGRMECHHIRGRIGALLLDERFWAPLCPACHRWVGEHPREARAAGLLAGFGEWNTVPKT